MVWLRSTCRPSGAREELAPFPRVLPGATLRRPSGSNSDRGVLCLPLPGSSPGLPSAAAPGRAIGKDVPDRPIRESARQVLGAAAPRKDEREQVPWHGRAPEGRGRVAPGQSPERRGSAIPRPGGAAEGWPGSAGCTAKARANSQTTSSVTPRLPAFLLRCALFRSGRVFGASVSVRKATLSLSRLPERPGLSDAPAPGRRALTLPPPSRGRSRESPHGRSSLLDSRGDRAPGERWSRPA